MHDLKISFGPDCICRTRDEELQLRRRLNIKPHQQKTELKNNKENPFSYLTRVVAAYCLLQQTYLHHLLLGINNGQIDWWAMQESQQHVTALNLREPTGEVMKSDSRPGAHFDAAKSNSWQPVMKWRDVLCCKLPFLQMLKCTSAQCDCGGCGQSEKWHHHFNAFIIARKYRL